MGKLQKQNLHIMGISEESKTEWEEISETIKTENASFLINLRHQTTEPGNAENTKKDKCKKNKQKQNETKLPKTKKQKQKNPHQNPQKKIHPNQKPNLRLIIFKLEIIKEKIKIILLLFTKLIGYI